MKMGKRCWNLLESRPTGNIKAEELRAGQVPFLISWSCATTASVLSLHPALTPVRKQVGNNKLMWKTTSKLLILL